MNNFANMLRGAYLLHYLVSIRIVRIGSGIKLAFNCRLDQHTCLGCQAIYGIHTLVIACWLGTAGSFLWAPKLAIRAARPRLIAEGFHTGKVAGHRMETIKRILI